MKKTTIRTAILSMYRDTDAQGLLYLQNLLKQESGRYHGAEIEYRIFQTRFGNEMPETEDYDLFISTGGPGNPHDGEGMEWEKHYFKFLDELFNQNLSAEHQKFHFSICHSFQLLCRHFRIATVNRREGLPRFGIYTCSRSKEAESDSLLQKLPEKYAVVENRSWQCIESDEMRLKELGITVLSKENSNPDSALLALRINPSWLATQFHPETNPEEMRRIFLSEEKKKEVVQQYGTEKWEDIMQQLGPGNSLLETYEILLPGFIRFVAEKLQKSAN